MRYTFGHAPFACSVVCLQLALKVSALQSIICPHRMPLMCLLEYPCSSVCTPVHHTHGRGSGLHYSCLPGCAVSRLKVSRAGQLVSSLQVPYLGLEGVSGGT